MTYAPTGQYKGRFIPENTSTLPLIDMCTNTMFSESKNLENLSNSKGSGVDADSSQKNQESQEICQRIKAGLGAINASWPGEDQYKDDIYHWATSSSQDSVCTFQPDTPSDVSTILKFIDKYRTGDGSRLGFGVKSGGHSGNPGFSSSPGVLVSMTRFNQVVYEPDSQTAVIGVGQIWDNVYEKLAQHNVTVLGARGTHVGVAGFILGGGYSWHTNQYGLAIDTITAFELVKPDGSIVNVTETSDPDLFFALKGGGNNFGIVTKVTMRTFPQSGPVWGGSVLLVGMGDNREETDVKIKDLFDAIQTFVDTVIDPKAAVLASLGTYGSAKMLNLMAFYDGPSPPENIFDMFKVIAPDETGGSWKTRSYLDLVQSTMKYNESRGFRGAVDTVALSRYTPKLLEAIWNENEYWGSTLTYEATSRLLISYSVEPFLPDILSHGSPSAYPCDRSISFSPFPVYISWEKPEFDTFLQESAKKITRRIRKAAVDDGIEIGGSYPNYAIFDTPLEELYGTNVQKLKEIKARVDPANIMGLAGGFKF